MTSTPGSTRVSIDLPPSVARMLAAESGRLGVSTSVLCSAALVAFSRWRDDYQRRRYLLQAGRLEFGSVVLSPSPVTTGVHECVPVN